MPVPPVIKPEQWLMPVSFDKEGQPVSLREYVRGNPLIIPFPELTDDQRTELAVQRVAMQPNYRIATLGVGVFNQEQAIAEVRRKTRLGMTIVEVEMGVIRRVITKAEQGGQ